MPVWRCERSRAASAASTMPMSMRPLTVPGPPGLAPSRSRAEAEAAPYSRPAWWKKPNGSSVSDQGARTSSGVPSWARNRGPYAVMSVRRTASSPTPRISATGHTIGVNAVVTVSSSAYAQVARQLPRAPAGFARPLAAMPARAMSGSSTARTAVPRRPPARAPVAAGRKA